MSRKATELGALAVSRLREPGLHAVGGVSGLYLQVTSSGARSWILRATVGGKRRDMGLGGFPDVTLAFAREKAREARSKIEQGLDPILERERALSLLRAEQAKSMTFEAACQALIDAKSDEWRNPKHRAQWAASLATYAYPTIGKLQVGDVGQAHILSILQPIWKEKTETATRLRGRIEQALDWARVRGFREGENPARWRGHLDKLLPAPTKIAKVVHHKALPIDAMPGFMAQLRQRKGLSARALEFLVLTAARSGEVRGATWQEIDMEAAVWTVPAERMKAQKEHRVPLSPQALALLAGMPRVEGNDLVFPAPRGGQLSDMTLTNLMRRMELDAVPHGMRSTFRDWAAERTHFPREVAEMALAHTIGNAVEAAYRRGDLFTKRAEMMANWGNFCQLIPNLY
ncbi:tyrosine-type recombinase/integrase [Delftia tsuruhatensis]|uniref:tyrosine-type recombinase/integrase n=2 Tax=Delftia TaxID=80865 RepID=UPI0023DB2660|nr:site-specific integrase [Delftia tsuruhatensis]MDH0851077.1 integrase arm-type DNA-binding domain-containing protein [Delftia tsuruhatensis]WEM00119.1 integrase arm-type DNA-binding domain-containing protein [Delftia tsuruhatensis]